MATGAMTIANEAMQGDQPLSSASDRIDWRVVPATFVAAGIFYAIEQANSTWAKGLAWLAFFTAFVGGDTLFRPDVNDPGKTTTPLGTLMQVFGYTQSIPSVIHPPGTNVVYGGLPSVTR